MTCAETLCPCTPKVKFGEHVLDATAGPAQSRPTLLPTEVTAGLSATAVVVEESPDGVRGNLEVQAEGSLEVSFGGKSPLRSARTEVATTTLRNRCAAAYITGSWCKRTAGSQASLLH